MKKIILGILSILLMLSVGCTKEDIKIGFIGDLSSKNSQLAIDARNAIEFAIEEVNAKGGIDGKHITLVVKDDQGLPDVALEMHKEFEEENVQFVLGHLTSNMADAMETSQSNKLLFLSPSISSITLSQKDDYIIRTSPILSYQTAIISDYLKSQGVQSITLVYDTDNSTYTQAMADTFEDMYVSDTYVIENSIAFSSRENELSDVVNQILESKSENVFIIAQAMDTAHIMQSLDVKGRKMNGYSVSWSMTNDLIQNGGDAVDSMIFIGLFVPKDVTRRYVDFQASFKDRYNYDPSFISVLAYDAFEALLIGLDGADAMTPDSVKEYLINREKVVGLQEVFNFDEYGDNDRQFLLYQLTDGQFMPMRNWSN